MKKLIIKTTSKQYPIFIGSNFFKKKLASIIPAYCSKGKVAIITDSNLKKKYVSVLKSFLNHQVFLFSFKAGEPSKNRTIKEQIEDFLITNHFNRKSLLIAFGGGVVGDIVGFVAATLYRGIDYIQIPTSIISIVDSSIGGKTGINTLQGKNLIGAFYHPKKILLDIDLLKTLPQKEYQQGLAEVIKYALILDISLYKLLVQKKDLIFKRDQKTVIKMIIKSILCKKKVVKFDEKEERYRQILNFGHTIGHGIEKGSNYKLSHGNSIAIGMLLEAFLAKQAGILSNHAFNKVRLILKQFEFSLKYPAFIKIIDLYDLMLKDKKNTAQTIQIVFIESIGKAYQHKKQYTYPFFKQELIKQIRAYQALN